jgi:hypothetical protein
MEDDIRAFFIRIVQGVSMMMLWMLVNMTFGIYFGFAFLDKGVSIGNYIYYACMIISFFFVFKYIRKRWIGKKTDPPTNNA